MAVNKRKERKCTSSRPSRKAGAVEAAAKKFKLPKGRASKVRLMELTAQLDSQIMDVHALNAKVQRPASPASSSRLGGEGAHTVGALADVLRGL